MVSSFNSSGPPGWPSYSNAVSFLPWLSAGLGPLTDVLGGTAVALMLFAAIKVLKDKGKLWLGIPLLLALGLTMSPNPPGSSWGVWVALGLAAAVGIGLAGFLTMKLGWAILPGLIAAPTLLEQLEAALLRPFPGSMMGAALGLCLAVAATIYWTRALERTHKSTE